MKRKIILLLLITILSIITVFIVKIFKKNHNITYNINNYVIKESFYINNKKNYYDIVIKNNKNNYTISVNKKIGKKKKIIKDIKTIKNKNFTCIVPKYKNNIKSNIYCNIDKQSVSNDYLLKNNIEIPKTIKKLIKKYNKEIIYKDNLKKYKKLYIYNIPDYYKFIFWDYKGIYILNSNKFLYKKILNKDIYENIMSIVIDKYYVLLDNSSINGIDIVYYYDLEKNKLKSFKLKNKLSKDSYINGLNKNLIYITDNKEKKQYTLNIKKKSLEEISYDNIFIKYTNNKPKYFSKSDFFMNNKYFSNEIIKDNKLNYNDLRKDNNYFYYLENNKIYKALNTNKKNSTLLLELSNIKDWKVNNDDILLLSKDTIYLYNDDLGLRKILKTNELNYNYKNIYSFYKT